MPLVLKRRPLQIYHFVSSSTPALFTFRIPNGSWVASTTALSTEKTFLPSFSTPLTKMSNMRAVTAQNITDMKMTPILRHTTLYPLNSLVSNFTMEVRQFCKHFAAQFVLRNFLLFQDRSKFPHFLTFLPLRFIDEMHFRVSFTTLDNFPGNFLTICRQILEHTEGPVKCDPPPLILRIFDGDSLMEILPSLGAIFKVYPGTKGGHWGHYDVTLKRRTDTTVPVSANFRFHHVSLVNFRTILECHLRPNRRTLTKPMWQISSGHTLLQIQIHKPSLSKGDRPQIRGIWGSQRRQIKISH